MAKAMDGGRGHGAGDHCAHSPGTASRWWLATGSGEGSPPLIAPGPRNPEAPRGVTAAWAAAGISGTGDGEGRIYPVPMVQPHLGDAGRCAVPSGAGLLLALLAAATVQARPLQSISASGAVPASASVEVRDNPSQETPQLSRNGNLLTVAGQQTVQILATATSHLVLSPLQLTAPSGVSPGNVAAAIQLSSNGSPLVGATTAGGGSRRIPGGAFQASVNVRFYSTNGAPLPAGTYTATTLLSVVTE